MGYTKYSRPGIFSFRCAPVQVNYLGFPGSTGAPYIDYIIADRTIIPDDSQRFYSEKIVYMPHSYQANDSKRKISKCIVTKQEAGLPENGFVFCCFNNSYKILPCMFDSWMRILNSVDNSVIWLLASNPSAIKNLCKEADARGVDVSRLIFADRVNLDKHLARHNLANLFLDTWPYNAHTTASDALWTGLPVLTLIGKSFASRVAASLLKAIDLPELITESHEQYESMAINLAMNQDILDNIKAKLMMNRLNTSLFDTRRFARNLEAAYIAMHQRRMIQLKPHHLKVVDQT